MQIKWGYVASALGGGVLVAGALGGCQQTAQADGAKVAVYSTVGVVPGPGNYVTAWFINGKHVVACRSDNQSVSCTGSNPDLP